MPLTILDHVASESVALQAGWIKTLLAGTEIHAAVRENFEDHPDGGHRCKLCGERVGHPRAAAAHLAVKHWHALRKPAKGDRIAAVGTSEGASKGWDARGRRTHDVLVSSGFKHRGTDNGLHKYTGKTREKDTEEERGRVINHSVWVDKQTGAWAHESGPHGLGMARGRGDGPGSKSLDSYIGSGRFHGTHALSRNGPVWDRLR